MNQIALFKDIVQHVQIILEDGVIDIGNDVVKSLSYFDNKDKNKNQYWDISEDVDHIFLIGIENSFLTITLRKGYHSSKGILNYKGSESPLRFLYIPMHRVISIQ